MRVRPGEGRGAPGEGEGGRDVEAAGDAPVEEGRWSGVLRGREARGAARQQPGPGVEAAAAGQGGVRVEAAAHRQMRRGAEVEGGSAAEAGAEPRTGGPSTAAEDMAVAGAGGAVAPGTGGRPTRCAGLPAAAAAARAPPPRLAGKKRPLQTDVCGEHRVGGRFGGLGVVLGCVCRLGFRAA